MSINYMEICDLQNNTLCELFSSFTMSGQSDNALKKNDWDWLMATYRRGLMYLLYVADVILMHLQFCVSKPFRVVRWLK